MHGLMFNYLLECIEFHHPYDIEDTIIEASNLRNQGSYDNVYEDANFIHMSTELSLRHKQLQLCEVNHNPQLNLDDKNKELQTLNHQLAMSLKKNDGKLNDNSNLLNEYKKAIDHSTIVSMTDVSGQITYVNNAFTIVSGFTKEELLGNNHNIIRHPDNPPQIYKEMWEKLLNKKTWHGVIKNLSKDKTSYYVDTTITPILDKHGEIEKFLALRHNITKVIDQEKRINRQLTDRLTDLPNRMKLIEDLESKKYQAITILNIDSFQEINDLYGQKIGDELLKNFAIYLSKIIRKKIVLFINFQPTSLSSRHIPLYE